MTGEGEADVVREPEERPVRMRVTNEWVPFSAAECVVLRHALMTYRNGLADRNRDDAPYPIADGFELVVADDLVIRLDAISADLLVRDRETANAPSEPVA